MAVVCNSCNFEVSEQKKLLHYQSEWHRYNIKRRCAGLPSITEELFNQKLAVLQKQKQIGSLENTAQTCSICSKTFKTASSYRTHIGSKTHLKRASKKRDHLERKSSVSSDMSNADISSEMSEDRILTPLKSETKEFPDDESKVSSPSETKREERTLKKEPIPLRQCLFCPPPQQFEEQSSETDIKTSSSSSSPSTATATKKQSKQTFDTLQACLEHMLKRHGFFIPFVEYLTDLEGFLEYLGAKIGEGCTCLWCGKYRDSVYAVQQHMISKSHCKIRLETEEDEEEFMDFFTFPDESTPKETKSKETKTSGDVRMSFRRMSLSAEIAMLTFLNKMEIQANSGQPLVLVEQTPGTLVVPGAPIRHLSTMNDSGELVLSDGSTIGHRSMWRYYKQRPRPAETRESVLISQLAHHYLTLPGYARVPMHKTKSEWITRRIGDERARYNLTVGMNQNSISRLRYRERNAIII